MAASAHLLLSALAPRPEARTGRGGPSGPRTPDPTAVATEARSKPVLRVVPALPGQTPAPDDDSRDTGARVTRDGRRPARAAAPEGLSPYPAPAPLTSEPPLADTVPLTSESPYTGTLPLTSEPSTPTTAYGQDPSVA
ncbi:hypothetical protein ACIBCB_08495 [Streptomyces uncialis]|uniref:hypothetical protein n=1 Tax=Streptomyces uncialis TaxID=1048205 RepID=UPI002E35767C|nr:hypothetical protein [Streptomyces uncialis]